MFDNSSVELDGAMSNANKIILGPYWGLSFHEPAPAGRAYQRQCMGDIE